MTWTYTDAPQTVPLDEVRVLVGDTDTTDQLVSDEIINYGLSKGNSLYAAAVASRHIAAKFARLTTASVGSVSEAAGDLWKHYKELAQDLELKAGALCTPSFGGLTVSEHQTDSQNTDLVQSSAKRDQFDNPLALNAQDSPENKLR